MMRKKTKMAWSVALSAAMAAGLLAGCGSNGGSESKSGSTATSSAKTESSAGDTADTSDRPTYKIATVRWTDTWPTDFLHEGVMKEIGRKLRSRGVEVSHTDCFLGGSVGELPASRDPHGQFVVVFRAVGRRIGDGVETDHGGRVVPDARSYGVSRLAPCPASSPSLT